MAMIDVTFINVDDNTEMDARVEDGWNAEQVVEALVDNNFLPRITDASRYYSLAIKGRSTIASGQTLVAAGVQQNDRIRVSLTQRGGSKGM